jgi:hypothetical protein
MALVACTQELEDRVAQLQLAQAVRAEPVVPAVSAVLLDL